MINEEDTEKIIDLTLIPVRPGKETGDRWHRRGFVGICFDTDAGVVSDRKKVVNDLEAVGTSREVGGGNRANLGELGSSVVWKSLLSPFTTLTKENHHTL